MKSFVNRIAMVLLGACSLVAAQAHEFKAGKLEIHHPWARATPTGASTGAVYLKINNAGDQADTLLGASNPALAERIEIHNHVNDQGVMRMRQVDQVPVPAKGSALLAPGGFHIMLINLKKPLPQGANLPLTLRFAKAGQVKVEIKVEPVDVDAAGLHAGH
ncbi:copper chaperone PCu(A)C [Chitinimonas lacunae]|uniref:Copper chaperone PCu(A)C n=1 Tax=Chitinimonas lacunae TaxID=1963018 RepID=A0ABV8MMM1_9NEIS